MNKNNDNNKAINEIMDDLKDNRFLHLNKQDRIKYTFGLYHGKGKRKKKGRKK